MRLLISGCTSSVARFQALRPDRIGVLVVPRAGNRLPSSPDVYAADNGCFGGLDSPSWLRMLARLSSHPHAPWWVACPDTVADMGATWQSYSLWAPVLRSLALPVALVLQDGLERLKWRGPLPSAWQDLAAVFVGGSTEWKLSPEAFRFSLEAHERGKLVHFGRVNSLRRIRYLAEAMRSGLCWCDTFDGGSATRWGDTNIPKLIRWIDQTAAETHRVLF